MHVYNIVIATSLYSIQIVLAWGGFQSGEVEPSFKCKDYNVIVQWQSFALIY